MAIAYWEPRNPDGGPGELPENGIYLCINRPSV